MFLPVLVRTLTVGVCLNSFRSDSSLIQRDSIFLVTQTYIEKLYYTDDHLQ